MRISQRITHTPGHDRWFPGMLLSPITFRLRVSHQIQRYTSNLSPLNGGYENCATWRRRLQGRLHRPPRTVRVLRLDGQPHRLTLPTGPDGSVAPDSLRTIGTDTQHRLSGVPQFDTPNHQYDMSDFDHLVSAIRTGRLAASALPAVSHTCRRVRARPSRSVPAGPGRSPPAPATASSPRQPARTARLDHAALPGPTSPRGEPAATPRRGQRTGQPGPVGQQPHRRGPGVRDDPVPADFHSASSSPTGMAVSSICPSPLPDVITIRASSRNPKSHRFSPRPVT